VRDKASGIEMLLVPSGQFMMGKSAGDAEALANEVPAHSVTLTEPYYLGRYEVTREQWTKVMGAGAKSGAERVQPGVEGAEIEVGGGATIVVSGGVELVDQQRTIPEALQQRPIQAHKPLPASGRTEVNKRREVVLFQPRLAADQHGSPTGVSGRLANLLTQAPGSTGCGSVLYR
jgi:formylglycine-generating enzyme required for sulfatase activity